MGEHQVIAEQREKFDSLIPKGLRLLFLNGPNPNKRVQSIAPIVTALTKLGIDNVVVVTTLPPDNTYTKFVRKTFEDEGNINCLYNLGRIEADQVASCIDCCDIVCTFSVLESFSNNFVEAWAMGKPLVVTDSDWSRAAAGNAAVYVDVLDPVSTAESVHNLYVENHVRENLIQEGRHRLNDYATPLEKLSQYLGVLREAETLGRCGSRTRSRIRW